MPVVRVVLSSDQCSVGKRENTTTIPSMKIIVNICPNQKRFGNVLKCVLNTTTSCGGSRHHGASVFSTRTLRNVLRTKEYSTEMLVVHGENLDLSRTMRCVRSFRLGHHPSSSVI